MISVLVALSITSVFAGGHVTTLFTFNPAFGELPEGVAVDKVGNVYVGLSPLSKILKFSPNGEVMDFAFLPPSVPTGFGLLGLAVDAPGNVYAALATGEHTNQGVYKIDRDGTSERLPGTEMI